MISELNQMIMESLRAHINMDNNVEAQRGRRVLLRGVNCNIPICGL